ncbi:Calvin cycle protein CP12-2, chloroplastic [Cocos nucifera]|uniref:Calvin cycle protein CP12-2, chloroplastic n=1 Tax=Cocos nucifera TaxID=13894 RepID=A0A8K0IZ31_COCNU|nr:Calvin cycle protein CP12-2, chloroplastic [Cocos nucifera]
MATAPAGVSFSFTKVATEPAEFPKVQPLHGRLLPWAGGHRAFPGRRTALVASAPSTPPGISEKVAESIKKAEEACEGNAESGECAAAWDEVEELSAAASHARDKLKGSSDPLENYCKDNPETEECRIYED